MPNKTFFVNLLTECVFNLFFCYTTVRPWADKTARLHTGIVKFLLFLSEEIMQSPFALRVLLCTQPSSEWKLINKILFLYIQLMHKSLLNKIMIVIQPLLIGQ